MSNSCRWFSRQLISFHHCPHTLRSWLCLFSFCRSLSRSLSPSRLPSTGRSMPSPETCCAIAICSILIQRFVRLVKSRCGMSPSTLVHDQQCPWQALFDNWRHRISTQQNFMFYHPSTCLIPQHNLLVWPLSLMQVYSLPSQPFSTSSQSWLFFISWHSSHLAFRLAGQSFSNPLLIWPYLTIPHQCHNESWYLCRVISLWVSRSCSVACQIG